jgi:hypothetical protein
MGGRSGIGPRRRRRRARVVLLGSVIALVPASAAATEVRTVARTIGEGYMVRAPQGQLLSRRRIVQYVNLGVLDILPPREPGKLRRDPGDGQLRIVTSMRLRHDFGAYQREASGTAGDLIASLDGRQIDLLYGYLEGDSIGGWVDFRAGRQLEMSGLDFYAFDGGWIRARTPAHIAAEAFAGFTVDGTAAFGYPTFELDGTQGTGADRVSSPMAGGGFSVVGLSFLDARFAYRRTWTPGVMGEDLVDSDGTLGLRPAVDQEIVSSTAALRLFQNKLSPFFAARYNLGTNRVDDLGAGVYWALTEMHSVRAQYLRTIPAFDLDSIFNVFSVTPFEDVRVVYQVKPGPRWTVHSRFQGRIFRAEDTAAGTAPEEDETFGGGGGAGAAYQRRRFALRMDGFGLGGQGGVRAGGSVDARTFVLYDRFALDTRGFFVYWKDDVTAAREGWSLALQAGGNLRLAHGIYLNVIGEQMFTPYLKSAFRALGVLSIDWAFRVGRR